MKGFKNMFFGLIAGSTVAISFGFSAVQSAAYAQSDRSTDNSETIVISAVPEIPNWDYSTERGPWPTRLGLSDEQMEQLISLKSEYSVNTAKQKAELEVDMKKLMLLMTEPKLDKQAVFSLNEKIDALKVSLSDARVNQMLSAMNVMTPKQREEMRHHILERTLSHHHSMSNKSHKDSGHHHRDAA